MTKPYTATPEEVREDYARLGDVMGIPREVGRAEFDRMLARVRAEAAADGVEAFAGDFLDGTSLDNQAQQYADDLRRSGSDVRPEPREVAQAEGVDMAVEWLRKNRLTYEANWIEKIAVALRARVTTSQADVMQQTFDARQEGQR